MEAVHLSDICIAWHFPGSFKGCHTLIENDTHALRKLVFHFLSYWMGYGRGDSFPFDLNQMEFHLVQNRKESCHRDHIPFNVKGNGIGVFSVFMMPRDTSLSDTEKSFQNLIKSNRNQIVFTIFRLIWSTNGGVNTSFLSADTADLLAFSYQKFPAHRPLQTVLEPFSEAIYSFPCSSRNHRGSNESPPLASR